MSGEMTPALSAAMSVGSFMKEPGCTGVLGRCAWLLSMVASVAINLLPGGARRIRLRGLRAQRRRRYERQRHGARHSHAPAPMNRATSSHRGSMCWSNW